MKYITETQELKGKVIRSAKLVSMDESLAIVFEDDTCIFLNVSHCGDSYEVEFATRACADEERDAGIISEADYNLERDRLEVIRRKSFEATEREVLKKLKAKYDS